MQSILLRRSRAREKRNAEVHAEIASWLDDVLARTEPEPIIATPPRHTAEATTAEVG
jgi:hypothetical protein